jgi:hypothetical protein
VTRLLDLLAKLLRSDKLRTVVAFGTSAAAFAVANLLFAGHLTPEAYGKLALVVAILAVGSPLAPLGLGFIVVREGLSAEPRLLLRCGVTSVLVAVGSVAVGALVYALSQAELAVVAVGVVGGGFVRLASAMLQSDERFVASTLASESINYLLLAAALGAIAAGATSGVWPLTAVAAAQLVLAFLVWAPLLAAQRGGPRSGPELDMTELLLLSATNAAMLVLFQVERFAIPMFLGLEQLAAFAVLSVFTVAPFRPIEFSIYRTLLPKMRRPATGQERRRLFLREVGQTAVVLAAIGLAIAAVTPFAIAWLFGDKFQFSFGAILAGIAGGQLRVARSLVSAAIAALADQKGLAVWNGLAWLSVAASFLGGWLGAPWGLEGFLWGVVAGGLTNILLTVPILRPHLR